MDILKTEKKMSTFKMSQLLDILKSYQTPKSRGANLPTLLTTEPSIFGEFWQGKTKFLT